MKKFFAYIKKLFNIMKRYLKFFANANDYNNQKQDAMEIPHVALVDKGVVFKPLEFNLVDGEVYENPTDYKQVTVTYKRNFKNTNLQAWYVPFDVDVTALKDDFTFYEIIGVNDTGNVLASDVTEGIIKANTPSIIQAKKTGEQVITIEKTNLYKSSSESISVKSGDYRYKFTGTYTGVSGTEMYNNQYRAFSGGKLATASSANVSLGTFRWYAKMYFIVDNTLPTEPIVPLQALT